MKKMIIVISLFAFSNAMAATVEQCVNSHFEAEAALKNTDLPFEKDQQIMQIWCKCTTEQEKTGKSEYEALVYCAHNTNDAINKHLKMGPYSKQ